MSLDSELPAILASRVNARGRFPPGVCCFTVGGYGVGTRETTYLEPIRQTG